MPSNYTQNYNLNQWEPDDQVCRADFNADNAKIDTALGALSQSVAGKGNCSVATGIYVGTDEKTKALDFANTLGRTPKLLLVRCSGALGQCLCIVAGMTTTINALDYNSSPSDRLAVSWTATGVSWSCISASSGPGLAYNSSNNTYFYVAFA